MSPDPNWLLPARSIPVWVGAHVLCGGRPSGVCTSTTDECDGEPEFGLVAPSDIDVIGANPKDVVIDLSNPDTFAAARDRLALRMGVDPKTAAKGIMFASLDYPCGWLLVWSGSHHCFADIPTDATRELALALAWQMVVGS